MAAAGCGLAVAATATTAGRTELTDSRSSSERRDTSFPPRLNPPSATIEAESAHRRLVVVGVLFHGGGRGHVVVKGGCLQIAESARGVSLGGRGGWVERESFAVCEHARAAPMRQTYPSDHADATVTLAATSTTVNALITSSTHNCKNVAFGRGMIRPALAWSVQQDFDE